jgi:predicted MFS family arabinose efflux permease
MGLVMAGTTSGFLVGPALGGWLYETGGARFPYLAVAGLALAAAAGLAFLHLPPTKPAETDARFFDVIRAPAVALCIITVIVGGGTIAMIEPVLSLFLSSGIGLGPARIGLVFGAGAVVSTVMHPIFGRIADRVGSRALMLGGLAGIGVWMPVESRIQSFESALLLNAIGIVPIAAMVTPSLAYMAEATSTAGSRSFGISYGLYNFAWALGILGGPSIGGYIYERLGFPLLTFIWGGAVVVITVLLAWARPISGSPAAV